MCGIAGFIGRISDIPLDVQCQAMVNKIIHRGPDENNVWCDEKYKLGMGHSRLAIQDLTVFGRQPMVSRGERFVIIFNGEIYNHLDLRKQLEEEGALGSNFRGHSDTETLLECINFWGVEKTLQKILGMFAFALWDKEKKHFHLVRDRIGEKPLYYGIQNGVFLFGSELKSLKEHPAFENKIDRNAITLQLRYNYIPAPHSIYIGIKKLLPGTLLTLPLVNGGMGAFELPNPKPYWTFENVITAGRENNFEGSEKKAIDGLDFVLRRAVKRQMISDVPIGAFLSGGIDSSLIAALMQAQSSEPVKTFSIGFFDKQYNEANFAKKVAQHLKTNHTEMYVSSNHAREVIPELPQIFDEPFSDSSQIPTYLVSKLTKNFVTVSLSGDGGDELFGGYNRYFWTKNLWTNIMVLPRPIRMIFSQLLTILPPNRLNQLAPVLMSILPSNLQLNNFGDKAHKLASMMNFNSTDDIYHYLISHWKNPSSVILNSCEPSTILSDFSNLPPFLEPEHRMMAFDTLTYLPDDILTKVDRSAMAVSLETRIPFLDPDVIDFAWRLPLDLKIRKGSSKWILRRVLERYVPEHLFNRPKMGFGVPIDHWLRGPLKEWGYELIKPERLKKEGIFNSEIIEKKWHEHQSGSHNWQYLIWDVLMFQAWLEQNS